MTDCRSSSTTWSTAQQCVGFALLLQFTLVCVIKGAQGKPEEIWWLSHISLLTSSVGLIGRRPWLIATALTNVLLLHAVWLADLGAWLLTGDFPFLITAYLAEANRATWLATSHHFYLMPGLLLMFLADPRYRRESLLLACCLFLLLTLISSLTLPAAANVNYAFFVPRGIAPLGLGWLNQLPRAYYLAGLNLTVSLFMFVPAAMVLTVIAHWRGFESLWASRRRENRDTG